MLKSASPMAQLAIGVVVLERVKEYKDSVTEMKKCLHDPTLRAKVCTVIEKHTSLAKEWKPILDTLCCTNVEETEITSVDDIPDYLNSKPSFRGFIVCEANGKWLRTLVMTGYPGANPVIDLFNPADGSVKSLFHYRNELLPVLKSQGATVLKFLSLEENVKKVTKKENDEMTKKENDEVTKKENEMTKKEDDEVTKKDDEPSEEPSEKKRKIQVKRTATTRRKLAIPVIESVTSEEESKLANKTV